MSDDIRNTIGDQLIHIMLSICDEIRIVIWETITCSHDSQNRGQSDD